MDDALQRSMLARLRSLERVEPAHFAITGRTVKEDVQVTVAADYSLAVAGHFTVDHVLILDGDLIIL